MATHRLLKRAKLWMLLVCVVGVGFTCSQALAEEPPPTDPTPTVPEPPPVTASGPVTTVSSPPTPGPIPAPDPRPVKRKRAPVKVPAPVRKPTPVPKQTPAQAPARVITPPAKPAARPMVEQPATPTPGPATPTPGPATTPQPVTRVPARPATTAVQLRASKLHRIGSAQKQKHPARAAAAARKAGKSPKSASQLQALARDVPSVPPVSVLGRGPAPSGAEQATTSLRWLFVALLGTAAVFFTAVGSRRVIDSRARARLSAGDGHVLARRVPPPAAPVSAKQNGKGASKPERVVARPAPHAPAPAGTCEIGWSRGYFKSDFYVAASEPEGGVSEVARSPAFRWTAAGEPPQDEAIAAAHAALVEKLVALGWEEVGAGESWYARRYQRRVETPVH
jgi:hypothetical protein